MHVGLRDGFSAGQVIPLLLRCRGHQDQVRCHAPQRVGVPGTLARRPLRGHAAQARRAVRPRAGTSERGVCPACLSPWERVVERGESDYAHLGRLNGVDFGRGDCSPAARTNRTRNSRCPAWRKLRGRMRCRLAVHMLPVRPVSPCRRRILDPFCGSGTTGVVATAPRAPVVGLNMGASIARWPCGGSAGRMRRIPGRRRTNRYPCSRWRADAMGGEERAAYEREQKKLFEIKRRAAERDERHRHKRASAATSGLMRRRAAIGAARSGWHWRACSGRAANAVECGGWVWSTRTPRRHIQRRRSPASTRGPGTCPRRGSPRCTDRA